MNPKIFLSIFFSVLLFFSFYFIPIPEISEVKNHYKLYYTDDMIIPHSNITANNSYVYQLVPPPQDTIPFLSSYMDYATNGNTLKQLIKHGDTLIASSSYVDSMGASNPNNSNSLAVVFNYSTNNGVNWVNPVYNPITSSSKSRFGDGSIFSISGEKTVLFAGRNWNSPISSTVRRAGVSYDVLLGASSFTLNRLEGTLGFDMSASIRVDNKAACLVKTPSSTFTENDTLYYTTYTPNHAFPYSPLKVVRTALMDNSACSYTIAASPIDTNHITVVYNYINDHLLFTKAVTKVQISTNAGNNWSVPYEINPLGLINGDSSGCYWHEDIAYKPGTNEPFIVFSADASGVELDTYRKGFKICIWNPTLNGGSPVVIADWHNIPVLMDNSTFYRIRKFHVNSVVLNHPSIGFRSDGNRIFVAFSVCQVDTSSLGFTYEDVFYSYSDNGGLNWSVPVNLTNSPNAVEKYPIVPKLFTGNLPPVMYQWDQVPGCQSFNDNAPVNRVYWILKRDILTPNNNNEILTQSKFLLHQNYPNPFNPSTRIRFEIPNGEYNITRITVYDVLGKEIRTLVNENLRPGIYETSFDANGLSSGIYFYKMSSGNFTSTKKLVVLK